jgi:hypothetical protein
MNPSAIRIIVYEDNSDLRKPSVLLRGSINNLIGDEIHCELLIAEQNG